MRIALVSPWPPEASGIANYAVFFKSALENAGVEVTNVGLDLPDTRSYRDIEGIAERFPLSDMDLAHFELGGGRIRHFLLLDALLKRYPQLAITATIHDPERLAWRGWGLSRFERWPRRVQQALTVLTDPYSLRKERRVAGRLRRAVVLTHGGATALVRRMGIPGDRVVVIPHGGAAVPYREPSREGPLQILFFGFLYPGKGIETLIEALCLVRAQGLGPGGIICTIAGGSRPTMLLKSSGNYVDSLADRLREGGIDDQAQIVTDVAEADIPVLYQSHHLLVLPYIDSRKISVLGRFMGSSGPLSWAIASGRGALVSDARALAEEVAAGNGAVFRQGNPQDLAGWLVRLAADRDRVMAWSAASKALARERTWDEVGRKFARLFAEIA